MIPDEDLDRFEAWLRGRGYAAGTARVCRSYVHRADLLGAATACEVNAATRVQGTEFPHFAQTTRSGMRVALALFEEYRLAVPA
jgi:hypothetical protein